MLSFLRYGIITILFCYLSLRSYSEVCSDDYPQTMKDPFIECECEIKISQCYIKAWNDGYLFFERKPCNDCNNQTLPLLQNPRASCQVNGYTLLHNEQRHITINGNEACIYCACHVGEIKCIHHTSDISAVTCEGNDSCTNLMNSEDVKEKCTYPQLTYCFAQNASWVQYGCLWDCMEGVTVKKGEVIQKSWCQNMVTDLLCRKCPKNKERFVRDNKDLLWRCISGEVIWRYKICDSYQDCSDGSDEMNCTQQFCSTEIMLFGAIEYLSPSQFLVGKSIFVNCNNLSPTFYSGVIEFKCSGKTNPKAQTEYNRLIFDVCQCRELGFESVPTLVITNELWTEYDVLSSHIILSKLMEWSSYRYRKLNDVLKIKSKFIDYVNSTIFFDDEISLLKHTIEIMQGIAYSGYCDNNNEYERRLIDEMVIREKKISAIHDMIYIPPTNEQGKLYGSFSKLYQSLKINDDFIQKIRIALNESKANSLYSMPTIAIKQYNAASNNPSTDKQVYIEILVILDKFLTTISLLCLLTGVVLFIIYRKMHKNTKLHLHINLMSVYALSLFIQIMPSALPQYFKQYQTSCKVLVHVAYYTIFSTFTWITSGGINIFMMVFFTLECKRKLLYYTIGYGTPALLVTVLSCVSHSSFANSQNCLEIAGSLSLTKWPAGILITINIALLLVCTGLLVVKYKKSAKLRQTTTKISGMFRSCFALAIILGGTFVMGLFVDEASIAFSYAHVIINGSTGIIVFLFHGEGKTMIGRCLLHGFKKIQSVVTNTRMSTHKTTTEPQM